MAPPSPRFSPRHRRLSEVQGTGGILVGVRRWIRASGGQIWSVAWRIGIASPAFDLIQRLGVLTCEEAAGSRNSSRCSPYPDLFYKLLVLSGQTSTERGCGPILTGPRWSRPDPGAPCLRHRSGTMRFLACSSKTRPLA